VITTLWNQGIKKLGWCSLKLGIKGGKASPPQSIYKKKILTMEILKNVFQILMSNSESSINKKRRGVCIQVCMHIDHNKVMLKCINTTNIENTYLV